VEKQVLILFSVTNGYVDNIPLESLARYERDLFAFVDSRHTELWSEMRSKGTDGKAWDGLVTRMKGVLGEFGKQFAPEGVA